MVRAPKIPMSSTDRAERSSLELQISQHCRCAELGLLKGSSQRSLPQKGIIYILFVLRVGSALSEMGHKAAVSALCDLLGFFWNRNKSCMDKGMKPQVNTLLVASFCCLREKPNHPLIMEGKPEELQ